ncbi:phosphate ABC transporter permease subunit PstC [Feifania hominis]|uniref:Phosphate transport system permease protein n=1 Tax=Feifania hominis TaxID=2763660 RepID=A0A926HUB3_9FIRM|nr:phosphate ABC transporter permease subunit PstC [Feifania hominis]MBC8536734.1 phosphate ABC transporter permease subunit PstC [Feifania hominis]
MKARNLLEQIMKGIFVLCSAVSVVCIAFICFYLFARGVPAIAEIGFTNFIFGTKWSPSSLDFGIAPMIVASFYATLGAVLIGVPIGLFTAVFLARYCPKRLYRVLKPVVELLAGIPSVVYGFFGLVVIVPIIRERLGGNGQSLLAAIIILSIMILPSIINISETSIRAVGGQYYEGGLALGATHTESVFGVVLPAAKSGIITSIILGIGRAIGETMAVILVAGNSTAMPSSILDGVRTMTAGIALPMGYATETEQNALFGIGVVLFVCIILLNIALNVVRGRGGTQE